MRAAPRLLAAAAVATAMAASHASDVPPACAAFLGSWSGTWSQGYYGTNWIHITEVSPQCVAQVGYSPWEAVPATMSAIPVRDGVIEVVCHRGTGGTCRMRVEEGELRVRYTDSTGFVNDGVFRKSR